MSEENLKNSQAKTVDEKMARAPKGKGVLLMRRLANIGFAIAGAYFLYLIVLLGLAYKNNLNMAGEALGEFSLQPIQEVEPAAISALGRNPAKQVIVMWATWCGPCHSLLVSLRSEAEAGRLDPRSIVAVSMVEPERDVRAYLAKTPLPFNIALDEKGILARRLKVSGTPTVVLMKPQGVIESISTGGFRLSSKTVTFLKN